MTITSGRSYAIRRFLVSASSKREIRSLNSTTRIAVRFHSSTNQCPHSGNANTNDNTASGGGAGAIDTVKYVNVPKLPIVGSMIPMFSNSVWFELNKSYDVWYKHRKTFGDFYNFGFPHVGKGVTGESEWCVHTRK